MSHTKAQSYQALAAAGLAARGLSREQAAAYIGVSPVMFDTMVSDGRMPAPRLAGRRRIWDRAELDTAFSELPRDTTSAPRAGIPADDVWSQARV
jgi:excisionase family DNA binding protein